MSQAAPQTGVLDVTFFSSAVRDRVYKTPGDKRTRSFFFYLSTKLNSGLRAIKVAKFFENDSCVKYVNFDLVYFVGVFLC